MYHLQCIYIYISYSILFILQHINIYHTILLYTLSCTIQVKVCYLVAVLRQFIDQHREDINDDDDDGIHGSSSGSNSNNRKRSRSGNSTNSATTMNSIVQELCDELMNKSSNKSKGGNKSYGRLKRLNKHNNKHNNNKHTNTNYNSNNKYYNEKVKLTSSVMIFVGSCRRCAELTSTLQRLGQLTSDVLVSAILPLYNIPFSLFTTLCFFSHYTTLYYLPLYNA